MYTMTQIETDRVNGALLPPLHELMADIGVGLEALGMGMEYAGVAADATVLGAPVGVSLGVGGFVFGAVGAIAEAAGS